MDSIVDAPELTLVTTQTPYYHWLQRHVPGKHPEGGLSASPASYPMPPKSAFLASPNHETHRNGLRNKHTPTLHGLLPAYRNVQGNLGTTMQWLWLNSAISQRHLGRLVPMHTSSAYAMLHKRFALKLKQAIRAPRFTNPSRKLKRLQRRTFCSKC